MALGTFSTAKAMNMIIESTNESVLFRSDGTDAIKVNVDFAVHDYDHNVRIFIDGRLYIEAVQKDDFALSLDEEDVEKGWYRIDVATPAEYTIKVWRGALDIAGHETETDASVDLAERVQRSAPIDVAVPPAIDPERTPVSRFGESSADVADDLFDGPTLLVRESR